MFHGITPRDKVVNTSLFPLKSSAFDTTNYRSGGNPTNSTLSSDTPKGILGGMIARFNGNKQVDVCTHLYRPVGLFSILSEGLAYQNTPVIGSGVDPVYMFGGNFLVYYFETHSAVSAYPAFDLATDYAVGALLYCSPYGLLTPEKPSDVDAQDGLDIAVAEVWQTPTATNLELGIKLLV